MRANNRTRQVRSVVAENADKNLNPPLPRSPVNTESDDDGTQPSPTASEDSTGPDPTLKSNVAEIGKLREELHNELSAGVPPEKIEHRTVAIVLDAIGDYEFDTSDDVYGLLSLGATPDVRSLRLISDLSHDNQSPSRIHHNAVPMNLLDNMHDTDDDNLPALMDDVDTDLPTVPRVHIDFTGLLAPTATNNHFASSDSSDTSSSIPALLPPGGSTTSSDSSSCGGSDDSTVSRAWIMEDELNPAVLAIRARRGYGNISPPDNDSIVSEDTCIADEAILPPAVFPNVLVILHPITLHQRQYLPPMTI